MEEVQENSITGGNEVGWGWKERACVLFVDLCVCLQLLENPDMYVWKCFSKCLFYLSLKNGSMTGQAEAPLDLNDFNKKN